MNLVDQDYLGPKALARLYLRTWPYLKPQLAHIIALVVLLVPVQFFMLGIMMVAVDVLNNKVLIGDKLEPLQASLMMLDESYVKGPVSEDAGAEVEQLTDEQRRTVRDRMIVMLALFGFVIFTGESLINYYRTWIMQRINQFLRVTMIENAEHLSLRYHSHAKTGDAIYRVYQDSAMITSVVTALVLSPADLIFNILFAFVVVSIFSPTVGILFLAIAVPVVWYVAWYTPRLQWRSRHARETNSALISRIQEAFAAIRIVKANLAEHVMAHRFDADSKNALDAAFDLRLNLNLMWVGALTLLGLALLVTLYLMAGWTVTGQPTFAAGAFVIAGFALWNLGAFQAAQDRAYGVAGFSHALVETWGRLQDMSMGLERAFFLLDLKPDVVDRDGAVAMPSPIREVRYQDVRFAYQADTPVLAGVSLEASAGTVTAVVGPSGAGKTTLTSLLLRLYDPDSGIISINGTDLRDVQVNALRANIATALQQNVLFATTIAENIAYAARHAGRRDIEEAARIACADEFIRAMPQGYDTELGERGGKLSTGQRQRLSIARAIVRDTPILILDEPTASLDAETEQQVLANLSTWGRERIVFLITHRLSTIQGADQIVFLEDGVIAESGTHDTLLDSTDSRYRRFVNAELVGEQVDG